jgi:glycine C-acetyltransferase
MKHIENPIKYQGGDNVDLKSILVNNRHSSLKERISDFNDLLSASDKQRNNLYQRTILSPAGPEVLVQSKFDLQPRRMLMFGSNNYLDYANHPYIRKNVLKAIKNYGLGIGGPPLFNGTTKLHRELEERLSAFKKSEDTLLFSSGYNANVGLISALMLSNNDFILYDDYSHASFYDGLKMAKANSKSFSHNDLKDLEEQLMASRNLNKYIAVEGVYSMDGDTAPLDKIVLLAKKNNAIIILDDAHGSLVLGKHGHGTAEAYNVQERIDITVGTFSKAFAVTGGFISGSKELINYLRFFTRSYMFSASIPIPIVASVLSAIELSEKDDGPRKNLMENVNYAKIKLAPFGLVTEPEAAIITIKIPTYMNIREASIDFHEKGIFINSIEYPAVPLNEQRYRISLMSSHTKAHIDQLADCFDFVWNKFKNR